MSEIPPKPTPKIHPATREILPEDPMEMFAMEIPGDPTFMLQLLVEEYARMGWGLEDLMRLARDPNYSSFHGLFQRFGEDKLRKRMSTILSRCGVIRATSYEAPAAPQGLVQISSPK
ncbi:MAG: hypothetical protein KDA51_07445 [Planctomycetales bacterium]|nr:hypothetical protein [Planctomycetales bacterium]